MKDFSQVVVWPGTMVGKDEIEMFEAFVLVEFKTRVKYIEEIKTKPDWNNPETGGRNDVFFYVHSEDISKFAVPRLAYGMRWIEDVLDNEAQRNDEDGITESYSIYPDHVVDYRTW